MNKRIAFISMHTCPLAFEEGKETGGMNVSVMELASELSRQGHDVDVYTRVQSEKQQKIVVINNNYRVVHVYGGPERTPKKELIAYTSLFAANVAEFIKNEKLSYDVFHAHYYLSALAALKLKKKHGLQLPLIVSFHTLGMMKNLVARSELEKEETSRISAEKEICQQADLLLAVCTAEKEYLHYLYGAPFDHIAIVSPGVNISLFRPIGKKTARDYIHADINYKIILFVGRIEPLKGIDTLLYAVKILKGKKPRQQICLYIVGGEKDHKNTSSELTKLKKLQNTLEMKTSVTFISQQPQTKLPYYYNAADVVVIPSHYESFGITALEAIACGTPVITTNVSGIATLIDSNYKKLIVPASNPLILASQIEKTLLNTQSQEIKHQLTESIHNFTWFAVAKKISLHYQHAISHYGK